MILGGSSSNNFEFWNGTSWTEIADVSSARDGARGCGTAVKAINFGGGPAVATTDEFDVPETNKTITVS